MTAPTIKVRIVRRPSLKLKVLPRFPASVTVASPILLDRTGGIYAFSFDVAALIISLAGTFASNVTVDQEITTGATADVNVSSTVVRVNKTVGGVITLTLPLAASKVGAVLIADWKGDAGTNNITINPSGSEKIQGLSSWVIGGDNGSIYLRPITGVGYAI